MILKIGTTPIKGMSLNEAVELMRGPKGSEVIVTIGRAGESQPFDLTLTRDTIRVASVRERWLEPGYGYLRISQFQKRTGEDVRLAVERLQPKDCHPADAAADRQHLVHQRRRIGDGRPLRHPIEAHRKMGDLLKLVVNTAENE